MWKTIAVSVLGALALAGCASSGNTTGTIPGANPGVVLNSPVATGSGEPELGPVEGGLMGADVGRSLDDRSRAAALKAEYEALEYGRAGQPTHWQSGENRGEVVVGATYEVNRLDCREYTHNVFIGGRLRVVKGTACRQPDGAWRIVG
jgi:surface antigen